VGSVSFHEQCLDSTGPFSGRDVLNVCYLGKAGNRKHIERTKARLRVAKAGGKTIAHSTHFVLRCVLLWTSSRNDSGMPKHQYRVADQLARRAPKKAEIVSDFVAGAGNANETIKETKAKSKPAKSAPAKPEVTKRMLSKIARACKKAGTVKGGGTEADHEAFAFTLLNAGVPILERSSSRIARAIKGEIEIADLKVSGRGTAKKAGPKKAAAQHIAEQPISAGILAQLKSR
jgi:hypothetical protein